MFTSLRAFLETLLISCPLSMSANLTCLSFKASMRSVFHFSAFSFRSFSCFLTFACFVLLVFILVVSSLSCSAFASAMSSSRCAVLFLREIGKEGFKLDHPMRDNTFEIAIYHSRNVERGTLSLTIINIFKVTLSATNSKLTFT